jgi:hypothetical protein
MAQQMILLAAVTAVVMAALMNDVNGSRFVSKPKLCDTTGGVDGLGLVCETTCPYGNILLAQVCVGGGTCDTCQCYNPCADTKCLAGLNVRLTVLQHGKYSCGCGDLCKNATTGLAVACAEFCPYGFLTLNAGVLAKQCDQCKCFNPCDSIAPCNSNDYAIVATNSTSGVRTCQCQSRRTLAPNTALPAPTTSHQ